MSTTERQFLTRVQATHALGLGCASQMKRATWVPEGANPRVALRATDGTVVEAEGDEALHVQIMWRLARYDMEPGWTVDAGWWASTSVLAVARP
ncbi:MAG: hypothetical protein AB7I13_00230 [Vicinamibacterales bacterium]